MSSIQKYVQQKLFSSLGIFACFSIINGFANENEEYYVPDVRCFLFPSFCTEHLTTFPNICEKVYLPRNLINLDIIEQLSDSIYLIPHSHYQCSFILCENCITPILKTSLTDRTTYTCILCKQPSDSFIYRCPNAAIPHEYTTKYFIETDVWPLSMPYLKQHLAYSAENKNCLCYWPYRSKIACNISDFVYQEISLQKDFPYLTYKILMKELFNDDPKRVFASPPHPLGRILFTNAFFYTQYRQILLDLASWTELHVEDNKTIIDTLNLIYKIIHDIQPQFLKLYSICLEKHPHPKIFYERGMIYSHRNDYFNALQDMEIFLNAMEESGEEIPTHIYLQEGSYYAELGLYDKAISALSKSIAQDPHQKEAYLERACAYFEKGNFDNAIADFLTSDHTTKSLGEKSNLLDFSVSLVKGITNGATHSLENFIPSALSSIQGLGHGLWAFATDPKNVSQEIIDTSRQCIQSLYNLDQELLEAIAPELYELASKGDTLSENEKGELFGTAIGKYGTDIFLCGALFKGVKACRDLKKANEFFTIESMAKSIDSKGVLEKITKQWTEQTTKHIQELKQTHTNVGKALHQSFRSQTLSEYQVRKILHIADIPTFPKPKGLPDNCIVTFTKKHGGMKYVHPKNPNHQVRIMPGNPNSSLPGQQKPYVIHQKHGKRLDKYGNIVSKKSLEAHISLDEYNFLGWE